MPCGAGSYQPREAQDTCLVCPAGKTNVEVGATNEDQCKGTAKVNNISEVNIILKAKNI